MRVELTGELATNSGRDPTEANLLVGEEPSDPRVGLQAHALECE